MIKTVTETVTIEDADVESLAELVERLSAILAANPDASCNLYGERDDWDEDTRGRIVVSWLREQTLEEAEAEKLAETSGRLRLEYERLRSDAEAFARNGVPFPHQARLDELAAIIGPTAWERQAQQVFSQIASGFAVRVSYDA